MQRKLLIIFCLMGSVFITFAQKKKKNNKQTTAATAADSSVNYKEVGAPLPPLRFLHMKGKNNGNEIFTTKNLSPEKSLVIMVYNPTCGHCQEETILFKNNKDLFNNAEILLVADTAMKEYIDFFHNTTKVFDTPELKMMLDNCEYIKKTFRYQSLPQLNVYNKERKLIKVFVGDTPLDSLKHYIQ